MISYRPFQKLLIDRCLKKQEVMDMTGISSGTMARLGKSVYFKYVSLEVIDKLCAALHCQPGDLIQYVAEEKLE